MRNKIFCVIAIVAIIATFSGCVEERTITKTDAPIMTVNKTNFETKFTDTDKINQTKTKIEEIEIKKFGEGAKTITVITGKLLEVKITSVDGPRSYDRSLLLFSDGTIYPANNAMSFIWKINKIHKITIDGYWIKNVEIIE